jgi:predicted restriction endonuclease
MNYNVLRGLRELLSDSYLTTAEWKKVLAHFDSRCAFCGIEHSGNNRTGLVPDHLIAAVRFGSLTLGNTVPSCQDCNDHRGHADWATYLKEQYPKQATKRIKRIREYLALHPYAPLKDAAQILTPQELTEYKSLLATWETLWRRACALRDVIKVRRQRAKSKKTVDLPRTRAAL